MKTDMTSAEYRARRKPGMRAVKVVPEAKPPRPIGKLTRGKIHALHKYHCNEHPDGKALGGMYRVLIDDGKSTRYGAVTFACGCEMREKIG